MFIVYDSGNDKVQRDVLGALFDQPGMRVYDFVAIALNTHIFHVDVALKDEDRFQRVMFYQAEDVLKFAQAFDIDSFKISLQSKRRDGDDYTIKPISAILKGKTFEGHDVYVFQYSDKTQEASDFFEGSLDQIGEMQYVWRE